MLSKNVENETDVAYLKILCDFVNMVDVFEEGDEVSFGTFLGSRDWRLEVKVGLGEC
jgi:hypothetical protein